MTSETTESSLDQLCGGLSAIIDEDPSGYAWQGKALVLAKKVRRLIESDDDESLPEVDATCGCKRCKSRTKKMYFLKGVCTNCSTEVMVKIRKGDGRPLSIDCPSCEVTVCGWRR